MNITKFDHIVLTVNDVERACVFYQRVLGMEIVTFRGTRKAAHFGSQKINFHRAGEFTANVAHRPTAGSADICLISSVSIGDWIGHLANHDVAVELGPITRTGANGPIESIYFRDPDLNLIEVSNYSATVKSEKSDFLGNALVADYSGSELQSLLIGVHARRVAKINPTAVLKSWQRDRFVQRSQISPVDFMKFDSMAFEVAQGFEPIELSPVCPLGTNAALAPVSQNKVVGTIRNSEVVADSTNVMALESALRRRELLKIDPKSRTQVKLAASHRLVRAQKFSSPQAMAHFRLFTMTTAGRDSGAFEFESQAMAEHISIQCRIFEELKRQGHGLGNLTVDIYGEVAVLTDKVMATLAEKMPSDTATVRHAGRRPGTYYPTTSFVLNLVTSDGSKVNLGDGGITNWTGKLIANAKERFMISGLGTERLLGHFEKKKRE